MAANILRIPQFVSARTPERVRELFLEANAKHGLQHELISVNYVPGEKKWYLWYMEVFDVADELRSAMKGSE